MSFWAETLAGEKTVIRDNGVSVGDTTDTFLCPSCQEKMRYVSQSSNGRAAHFRGHHKDYCDIGFTNANEHIYEYELSKNTLQDFLNVLKNSSVKTRTSVPHKNINTEGHHLIKTKKEITTLRQLHNILALSNPEEELYDGVKVKDVYCGISTKYLYTKYINGLHLVFAQFNGYQKEEKKLYFCYPSRESTQIKICVSFSDNTDYQSFIHNDGNHTGYYFIIYAEFKNSRCTLDSLTQIIRLHK